jgi:hypothetical protein
VIDSRFDFRFSTPYRIAALPFGVAPSTCGVRVEEDRVVVRFGLWRVQTSFDNVADVAVTGPYAFVKTAGPAHLSLADKGLTFATNGDRGVCIQFHTPVVGIEPTGVLRHPNLTVTVADCDGLAKTLRRTTSRPRKPR